MKSMRMIKAKNAAPSIRAAKMIIAAWILSAISGCRAMLSTPALVSPPMPRPTRVQDLRLRRGGETGRVGDGRGRNLSDSRALSDQKKGDGQHGGLYEFHRTLHSWKVDLGRRDREPKKERLAKFGTGNTSPPVVLINEANLAVRLPR